MSQSSCPTCHRSATWSAKWQTCSACDQLNLDNVLSVVNTNYERTAQASAATAAKPLVPEIGDVATVIVSEPALVENKRSRGRPRKWASETERVAAYRARKAQERSR